MQPGTLQVVEIGDDYLVFARPCILEQPEAIQRYLFKMAIEVLRPGIRDLDYLTLERARNFLSTPTRSRKVEITQGLVLTQRGERLILSEAGFELWFRRTRISCQVQHRNYRYRVKCTWLVDG